MKTALIYARISQSDPKVEAIESQEKRCRALAAAEGYEVVGFEFDDGISAYSGKARPGWLRVLDAIKARKFDVLLAVADDRLTRSQLESAGLQMECAVAGATWHTLSGGKTDPSTGEGKLQAGIKSVVSEYESHVKSERVRASVQDRLAKGKDLGGRRAFGWDEDRLTIRPAEAALIQEAHRMLLNDNATIYSITKMFAASGIPSAGGGQWRTSGVRVIMRRARNCGRLEYQGQVIKEDAFPAIVSVEDHEAVLAIMNDPARRPKTGPKKSRMLSGILRCVVCGEVLRLASQTGGATYKCPKAFGKRNGDERHPSVLAKTVEDRVRHEIISAFMSGDSSLWASPDTSELATLNAQLTKLSSDKEALLSLVGDPDLGVTMADVRTKLRKVAEQRSALDTRREEVMAKSAQASMLSGARSAMVGADHRVDMDKAAEVWSQLSERFDGLDIDTRQTLIRDLLDVEVGFGRGPGKISIRHAVVTSLNAEAP